MSVIKVRSFKCTRFFACIHFYKHARLLIPTYGTILARNLEQWRPLCGVCRYEAGVLPSIPVWREMEASECRKTDRATGSSDRQIQIIDSTTEIQYFEAYVAGKKHIPSQHKAARYVLKSFL